MLGRHVIVIRFLVMVLGTMFITEVSVMFLMPKILPADAGAMTEALVDAGLLTFLSLPLLWWGVVRPLRQQIFLERDRFIAVVHGAANGILAIDEEGAINIYNPAAEKIFGYRADEIVGRNVSLLVPSPHSQRHDGYIRYYLRTGLSDLIGHTREVRGRRQNGETFPLELTVTETRVGHRRYFTASVKDLSSTRPDASGLDDNLEYERALDNLALTRFAHDLLVPVTVIFGHSDWLAEQSCSAKEKADGLRNIHDNARSLMQSIHHVLGEEPSTETEPTDDHHEVACVAESRSPLITATEITT